MGNLNTHMKAHFKDHFHDPENLRTTLAVMVLWGTMLGLLIILVPLKAAWWQIGLALVLVWLVRLTSRWEVL